MIECEECGSMLIEEKILEDEDGDEFISYKCDNCGHEWNDEE